MPGPYTHEPITHRRLLPQEPFEPDDEVYVKQLKDWHPANKIFRDPSTRPPCAGDLIIRRRIKWAVPGKTRVLDAFEPRTSMDVIGAEFNGATVRENFDPYMEHRRWLEARKVAGETGSGVSKVQGVPAQAIVEVGAVDNIEDIASDASSTSSWDYLKRGEGKGNKEPL